MQPGPRRDSGWRVLALAASAGGLAALSRVLSDLPADFPSPILVVQHLDRHHKSWMAEILTRRVRLDVRQALGGELIRQGFVYIAPPDRHLLVNSQGVLSLSDAALVRHVRPSRACRINRSTASIAMPRSSSGVRSVP